MKFTKLRLQIYIKVLYICLCAVFLTQGASAGIALLSGVLFSVLLGNPFTEFGRLMTHRLLQISVVGLGAGMNLAVISQVGLSGVGYTAVGIVSSMAIGLIIGKLVGVQKDTSLLVTVGTAICGGSAIAAIASTIRAKSHEVSVALGTVFCLNAAALFIFPGIGHYLNLSETQFGLWSALAIHDTSSVVGAAMAYGSRSVEIATTVKLARALWIIPVSIAVGIMWNRTQENSVSTPKKYPWFILGFILVAAIVTWLPQYRSVGFLVSNLAKRSLVLTLFLIGSGLTRDTLKKVGLKPFIQGVSLWAVVGSLTLVSILMGWIA